MDTPLNTPMDCHSRVHATNRLLLDAAGPLGALPEPQQARIRLRCLEAALTLEQAAANDGLYGADRDDLIAATGRRCREDGAHPLPDGKHGALLFVGALDDVTGTTMLSRVLP